MSIWKYISQIKLTNIINSPLNLNDFGSHPNDLRLIFWSQGIIAIFAIKSLVQEFTSALVLKGLIILFVFTFAGQGATHIEQLLEQLTLALTWNRSDVAEEKIFNSDINWPQGTEKILYFSVASFKLLSRLSFFDDNDNLNGRRYIIPN